MTPERWQKVEQLFHAALELQASQRAAFLDEACAGDPDLRSEVESLLAYDESDSKLMDASGFDLVSKQSTDSRTEWIMNLIGQTIGHYKIIEKLGQGGMGVIYRAFDTHLDRTVAIKVLPAEVVANKERKQRFVREAKAASALNHPNVAHIYEIGEVGSVHFIAMEYVEGQTLDAKLCGRPLDVAEITNIGIQIADALHEAHSKGVTHRDIKPTNIMITPGGQVKVLDFGLAKMAKPKGQALDSDSSTLAKTKPGVVMGTVAYMSPEQARGETVSSATDIFSFGIILYELTTGQHPFIADSKNRYPAWHPLATTAASVALEPRNLPDAGGPDPSNVRQRFSAPADGRGGESDAG